MDPLRETKEERHPAVVLVLQHRRKHPAPGVCDPAEGPGFHPRAGGGVPDLLPEPSPHLPRKTRAGRQRNRCRRDRRLLAPSPVVFRRPPRPVGNRLHHRVDRGPVRGDRARDGRLGGLPRAAAQRDQAFPQAAPCLLDGRRRVPHLRAEQFRRPLFRCRVRLPRGPVPVPDRPRPSRGRPEGVPRRPRVRHFPAFPRGVPHRLHGDLPRVLHRRLAVPPLPEDLRGEAAGGRAPDRPLPGAGLPRQGAHHLRVHAPPLPRRETRSTGPSVRVPPGGDPVGDRGVPRRRPALVSPRHRARTRGCSTIS